MPKSENDQNVIEEEDSFNLLDENMQENEAADQNQPQEVNMQAERIREQEKA